jgi:hypothetical protein
VINPKTGLTFVRKLLMSFPGLIVMALLLPKVPGIAKGIYKSLKKKPDVPDQPLGPREPMRPSIPSIPLDVDSEAKEVKEVKNKEKYI